MAIRTDLLFHLLLDLLAAQNLQPLTTLVRDGPRSLHLLHEPGILEQAHGFLHGLKPKLGGIRDVLVRWDSGGCACERLQALLLGVWCAGELEYALGATWRRAGLGIVGFRQLMRL